MNNFVVGMPRRSDRVESCSLTQCGYPDQTFWWNTDALACIGHSPLAPRTLACSFGALFQRSNLSFEKDKGGRSVQVWTLLDCGKPSALAVRCHISTVSSLRVCMKLAIACLTRDEETVRAANAFVNNIDCAYCSISRSNTSSLVPFSAFFVRAASVNRYETFFISPPALIQTVKKSLTKRFPRLAGVAFCNSLASSRATSSPTTCQMSLRTCCDDSTCGMTMAGANCARAVADSGGPSRSSNENVCSRENIFTGLIVSARSDFS